MAKRQEVLYLLCINLLVFRWSRLENAHLQALQHQYDGFFGLWPQQPGKSVRSRIMYSSSLSSRICTEECALDAFGYCWCNEWLRWPAVSGGKRYDRTSTENPGGVHLSRSWPVKLETLLENRKMEETTSIPTVGFSRAILQRFFPVSAPSS